MVPMSPNTQLASTKRVIVGLSGGVDSAIAAHRLLEQGYEVEALFMKNWEEDDAEGRCAAAADLADARAVAEQLGIRLHTVNFSSEYWDRVFEYFLREYRALRTPNPDVLCNAEIKFSVFLDYALGLGAAAIATGHYARISAEATGYHLHRAVDEDKDQTYFLHRLDQGQLARALFPLADLTKDEVRALAHRLGLANAAKKDSTGICFIGERRFSDFLARYLPREPGPIETPEGLRLGEHRGLAYYTIGQRQGLGIGGVSQGRAAPWYVAVKDSANNRLIVVQDSRHPLLMSSGLEALQPHWISGRAPEAPFRCLARLRHRQPLQACELVAIGPKGCQVRFDEPQRAVTPGQSIVFYQGSECLGGAIIERGLAS
ncbi:tRNA 2-thiouridine(34) synthase MnmA [Thermochromatium tepidum ATCC 43061]|jgi:tRNA (5-methylaminomethyl-2-thiouridylate)-methyltransferase (EC 2.1.1.61)|uniref:tRNA-specific 2-thiouridylase MnmA n=2 Tax=Thermochromatium tepidum TaxID=1050 RepID=A0A6I6ECN4_THETI|nr:tRNA 2-thiouridine(34) synthase MnmA [Thermochromatium tepidum]QGU32699.1 tRNA 2-thiouridine(34) synthase MnmA [Thermochromatium tepidum ATCC 43061]